MREPGTEGAARVVARRKAWVRPTVTVEGHVSDLVRSQNKPSGMGDSDVGGRKPTAQ